FHAIPLSHGHALESLPISHRSLKSVSGFGWSLNASGSSATAAAPCNPERLLRAAAYRYYFFFFYHLATDMPSNPFQFLTDLLSPLVDSDGLLMPQVPPPQRPLPATQKDYFGQLRIDIILEEWLHELLTQRPVETVRYSFHYFRRGASSRYQPEIIQTFLPDDADGLDRSRLSAMSPGEKYGRSRSPLQPGDARLSRLSPSVSPSAPPLPSDDEHDGYMGDVSPRPASSRNISPNEQRGLLEAPRQAEWARSPRDGTPSRHSHRSDGSHSPHEGTHKHLNGMLSSSSVSVSPVSSPEASPITRPAVPPRVKILVLVYSHERCRELAYGAMEGLHEADTFDVEPHLYRFPIATGATGGNLRSVVTSDGLAHTGDVVEDFEDDDPRYIPFLPSVASLPTYDGFVFVMHSRLGGRPADVHALLDATGGLWMTGALVGKPAATMIATFAQHSGLEFAHRQFHTALLHHGCVIVGANPQDLAADGIKNIGGSSPYGAGTVTGVDGLHAPSSQDLFVAKRQALRLAQIAAKFQKQS
ncbi:Hypothetical protein, putative, partial [Bodo saltans]